MMNIEEPKKATEIRKKLIEEFKQSKWAWNDTSKRLYAKYDETIEKNFEEKDKTLQDKASIMRELYKIGILQYYEYSYEARRSFESVIEQLEWRVSNKKTPDSEKVKYQKIVEKVNVLNEKFSKKLGKINNKKMVPFELYENDTMKNVLKNKLGKYIKWDISNFKVLYPWSATDVTPANVFSKDNVHFLDREEKNTKKLADEWYSAITKDLKNYTEEYDLVIEHRSQTKWENLAKNVKKWWYIVVENAHAKGNYFLESEDFEYIANLSKDTTEPYKKVHKEGVSSWDTNYYLFRKKS